MSPPIRGTIHALTEFPKEPEEMLLRDCLEWWKKCIRVLQGEMLNGLVQKHLNERWSFLVNAVAKREGVPTGSLSYYLAELASAEIRPAEEGEAESQAAQAYTGEADDSET